jgi:DNA invertase Pin-like site-specific DNA recombinase
MKAMPKAYSYLRFSTPDQLKGDSFRRQTEGSREYAKRHRLDLDETLSFKDLGVSAFRGKNVQEGELGVFIKAVETGKVRKGSYLLVENLDRLSRDKVRVAFKQFTRILELGVNIVTLTDNKVYTDATYDENISDILISIMTMVRAHDESDLKSKRLSAAWKAKRDKAQAGDRKLTARCPAWLQLDPDRKSFTVDSARAKVVRRIFQMTTEGHGKSVIARRFNAEGVPTFGNSKGWHPSYIQKILESESVTGVFQPMRFPTEEDKKKEEKWKRVPDGEPIPDYFPAVVDRATFERARRSRTARRIPTGRTGQHFTNLFSSLAVCGECGAPMHYINKGAGTKGGAYLVCSNARRAVSNCKTRGWKYGPVEALLILCLEELNYSELFPDLTRDTRAKLQELEDTKLETESDLARAKKQLDNLADLLTENPAQPTLKARLNTTQASFDTLTATLASLDIQIEDERERAKNAEHDFRQVQDGLARLDKAHKTRGPELYDLRSRLHQLLKRTVREIQLHPAQGAAFAPEHSGDWAGAVVVGFQSTKIARTLYVKKGLRECHSVPIRNGKPDFKKAMTLRMREA